jgi:hypothetical protein
MKKIFISHRIFITEEQRSTLKKKGAHIEATGICCVVLVEDNQTNEPAKEINCNYRIFSDHSKGNRVVINDNYDIYLGDQKIREWLNFNIVEKNILYGESHQIIHQIVISDVDDLVRSRLPIHFSQISSK